MPIIEKQGQARKDAYIVVVIDEMADLMMVVEKRLNLWSRDWHKWQGLGNSFNSSHSETKC